MSCSKFFGARSEGPARQSTLSFATKAGQNGVEVEADGDVSAKENTDPEDRGMSASDIE